MRKNSSYEKSFFLGTWIIVLGMVIFFCRPFLISSEKITHTIQITQSFLSTSNTKVNNLKLKGGGVGIWPYIIDGDLRSMWQTAVTSASPLVIGPYGLGSRSIVVYRARGKIWDVEEEVALYDPPFKLNLLTRAENYEGQTHIKIEEIEGAILLTYKVEKSYFNYGDRLWGLFTSLRESSELEFALNTLKALIKKNINRL
ncbi:MAG: hypothetical protein ACKVIX_06420 [Sphingomonadales bacterium]